MLIVSLSMVGYGYTQNLMVSVVEGAENVDNRGSCDPKMAGEHLSLSLPQPYTSFVRRNCGGELSMKERRDSFGWREHELGQSLLRH